MVDLTELRRSSSFEQIEEWINTHYRDLSGAGGDCKFVNRHFTNWRTVKRNDEDEVMTGWIAVIRGLPENKWLGFIPVEPGASVYLMPVTDWPSLHMAEKLAGNIHDE